MVTSKIHAAKILMFFREISKQIGDAQALLGENAPKEERNAFNKPLGQLLGTILCDIYYPIVLIHPELRPVELLGEKEDSARYVVKSWDSETLREETHIQNVIPKDAYTALERVAKQIQEEDRFCWLELEGCIGRP